MAKDNFAKAQKEFIDFFGGNAKSPSELNIDFDAQDTGSKIRRHVRIRGERESVSGGTDAV
jgi:hypothetical protein